MGGGGGGGGGGGAEELLWQHSHNAEASSVIHKRPHVPNYLTK